MAIYSEVRQPSQIFQLKIPYYFGSSHIYTSCNAAATYSQL